MPKKLIINLIKLGICFALLYFALSSSGILSREGFEQAKNTIASADLFLLALSIGFIFVMDIASTIKWKALTSFKKIPISFTRLLLFYIVGRFYNLILPSSIGGDIVRIHLQGKDTGNFAEAAAIVFVERFTGVIVLLLIAGMAMYAAGMGTTNTHLVIALILGAAGLATLYWLIMDNRPLQFLAGITKRLKLPMTDGIFKKIGKLQKNVHMIGSSGKALGTAFVLSFIFYAAAIINVWISVLVFQSDVSLWNMIIAVPIIMFIMNIPVSIGNIGIMEFGYTLILMQFGVSGDVAIATALLMRLKLFIAGGIGGIIHLALGAKKITSDEISKTPSV